MINEEKINNFKKDGFIHIRNFFNQQEINTFLKGIEKKDFFIENENIDRTVDVEEVWDFICNKKMLELIRLLIGNKIYYLHDAGTLSNSTNTNNASTWHRDNPCRRTGIGPDWNSKEKYNVVSVAVYLTDSDSILNVIKKSHFKNYKFSISNILRTIDLRLRNFKKLIFLKKIIKKLIGKNIKYKPGDLVVFYATLYHTGTVIKDSENSYRKTIISRYGGGGVHTKTFLNYEMNYRKGLEKYEISKKKDILFQKLMDNDIYISPQTPKEKIDGIFVPSKQYADSVYLKNKT